MELSKTHTFKTNTNQKSTLIILHKKYNINTSEFIRNAINEKLNREKETIFKNYKEIQNYIKKHNECPF